MPSLSSLKRKVKRLMRGQGAGPEGYVVPAPAGRAGLAYLARVGPYVHMKDRVEFGGLNTVSIYTHITHGVKFGYATTLSDGCWLRGPITFGNYCQMGPRVCLQAADHSVRHLTMYNSASLFDGELKKHTVEAPIELGHGVWCGYGAIILKGVKIGNGAVIGAGAIVTKDVPAYAIAVGSPARVIGQRFDDATCELVEASRWWLRSVDELKPFREVFDLDFENDRDRAADALRRMAQSVVKPSGAVS